MSDDELVRFRDRVVDSVSGSYRTSDPRPKDEEFKMLLTETMKSMELDKTLSSEEFEWVLKEAASVLGARGGRVTRKRREGQMSLAEEVTTYLPEEIRLFPEVLDGNQTLNLTTIRT